MNISAKQIQNSSVSTQLLKQKTTDILKTFQDKIINAGKNGAYRVSVGVPINFDVTGMDNKTAQTIVYHDLIQELEDNDFTVVVDMQPSIPSVTYDISWDDKGDDGELAKMRATIASHSKRKKSDKPSRSHSKY
jgi:hypothetical protein